MLHCPNRWIFRQQNIPEKSSIFKAVISYQINNKIQDMKIHAGIISCIRNKIKLPLCCPSLNNRYCHIFQFNYVMIRRRISDRLHFTFSSINSLRIINYLSFSQKIILFCCNQRPGRKSLIVNTGFIHFIFSSASLHFS